MLLSPYCLHNLSYQNHTYTYANECIYIYALRLESFILATECTPGYRRKHAID